MSQSQTNSQEHHCWKCKQPQKQGRYTAVGWLCLNCDTNIYDKDTMRIMRAQKKAHKQATRQLQPAGSLCPFCKGSGKLADVPAIVEATQHGTLTTPYQYYQPEPGEARLPPTKCDACEGSGWRPKTTTQEQETP